MQAHEFAAALPVIRPQLLHAAYQRFGARSSDDAEDLVQDACLRALNHLEEYHETADPSCVSKWLIHLMSRVQATERMRTDRRPEMVPLTEARNVPAPPQAIGQRPVLDYLTRHQADLVNAWLDGFTQVEIAQGFRIHPNTVGNRLELAWEKMRERMPRADELVYSYWLLSYCSRVSIYHKPANVWRNWFRQGPTEVRIGGPSRRRPSRAR